MHEWCVLLVYVHNMNINNKKAVRVYIMYVRTADHRSSASHIACIQRYQLAWYDVAIHACPLNTLNHIGCSPPEHCCDDDAVENHRLNATWCYENIANISISPPGVCFCSCCCCCSDVFCTCCLCCCGVGSPFPKMSIKSTPLLLLLYMERFLGNKLCA